MQRQDIPRTIRIGHYRFGVDPMTDEQRDSDEGCVNFRTLKILYDQTQHREVVAEILLHECLHIIWRTARLTDNSTEEDCVDGIAGHIIALLRDNPELTDLILGDHTNG